MVSTLYWIAGLLEGEGYFSNGGSGGSASIELQMNDKDVVEQYCKVTGSKLYGPYKHKRGDSYDAPHWRGGLHGIEAISLMSLIYPIMGERRQARISEVLKNWNPRRTNPPNKEVPNA